MNRSQLEASDSPIPKEAVATPADVVKVLTRTRNELEDLQKERDLAIYRSRAILSNEERNRGRGIELEKHYRTTGNKAGLAEALALQGRYNEAAIVADTPELCLTYQERYEAVTKDDSDCSCDSFREEGDYLLPNQHVEFYGYSDKHGRDMPFIRCGICNGLNAMAVPSHLTAQQQLRHSQTATDSERLKFFKK